MAKRRMEAGLMNAGWVRSGWRRSRRIGADGAPAAWMIFVLLAVGPLFASGAGAQTTPPSVRVPPEAADRLEAIYEEGLFNTRSFQADWLRDGSGYVVLERAVDPAGGDGVVGSGSRANAGSAGSVQTQVPAARELVRYDAATGERTVLASAADLTPPGADGPLVIQDYTEAPDGAWWLLETRESGYWKFDPVSRELRRVTAGGGADISPDGGRILFSDDGDLHVFDLGTESVTPLTRDGDPGSISNGRATWSPDGSRVAFVQSDVSALRRRSMLIPTDPSYPEVREVRFARVGETIATLRVGVVEADGTEMRWVSIPSPTEGFYLGQVSWAGNSDDLLVEQFSRFRDRREFFLAEVSTGEVRSIYRETDPAWVIASYAVNAGLEWVQGGDAFVTLSERDGWRHAYVGDREGGEASLLTPGLWDIQERAIVDHDRGWLYYYATPENATRRYLFRVRLDGSGEPERVTPQDQPGTHRYDFAPGAGWAFHTWSTFDMPPVTELVELPSHRVVRVLEDNAEVRERAATWITEPTDFFQLDIGEGVVMDAYMIKPRDFDSSRKYPVFIYVYGEPHGQTVLDQWSTRNMYHRVIADLGYLVVSIENRGTPAPKGAAWRRAVFGSLGPLNTEDHAAGVQEMGRLMPYVDLSRVGIWGWSGGGSNTLNALFRKPDVYHVGIAVAPKPQPHLYNAWFQEIYMETQETNPEGYQESAPINFAEGLEGDLLIVHGTGETNTHLEITEGLVDRLVELGKVFDYMTYPNRDHGLSEGEGTRFHHHRLMVRYLLNHLAPGGR